MATRWACSWTAARCRRPSGSGWRRISASPRRCSSTTPGAASFASSRLGRSCPSPGTRSSAPAWLLAREGFESQPCGRRRARCRSGSSGERTFIVGRPEWAPGFEHVELGSPAEVEALDGPPEGHDLVGVWAWEDEAAWAGARSGVRAAGGCGRGRGDGGATPFGSPRCWARPSLSGRAKDPLSSPSHGPMVASRSAGRRSSSRYATTRKEDAMIEAEKTYEHILFEQDGPVAYVTMNRPNKRNALSLAHMQELIDCFKAVGEARDAQVVVLRGEGPAFSAGHDLSEMIGRDPTPTATSSTSAASSWRRPVHPAARYRPGPRAPLPPPAASSRPPATSSSPPKRRVRDAGRQDRAVLLHPDGRRLAAP